MAEDILFSQSDKFLKFTVRAGACIIALSFIAIAMIVFRFFFIHIVPGWSSIFTAIMMMGGLVIISVGIVGIYVGNVFMQVKQRPLYFVQNELNVAAPKIHETNFKEQVNP